jgi:hypothetical protein
MRKRNRAAAGGAVLVPDNKYEARFSRMDFLYIGGNEIHAPSSESDEAETIAKTYP